MIGKQPVTTRFFSFHMRLLASLLLSILVLASCRDEAGKSGAGGQESLTEDKSVSGDFYKRLTGTIAGKQITLHLHRAGDWVGGAYSYDAVGIPISLTAWNDSTPGDNTFDLVEFSEAGPLDDSYTYPTLRITLTPDGAKGTWTSADSTRRYDVVLKESYDGDATRMKVLSFADSARLVDSRPTPQATARFAAVEHTEDGNEKSSINSAIQRLFGESVGSWRAIFSASARHFFVEYRAANEADTTDPSSLESEMYNWSTEQRATVWMNWNDWLVIRDFQADYTGGAHGNHGSAFLVLDRKTARMWTLTDVVADTSALLPFLHTAALDRWGLSPEASLDERLLVDAVPLTSNFYATPTGLGFVYNPYEIASYADGEVHLFIPYKRILLLLTEDFKQRMGLRNSAVMRG